MNDQSLLSRLNRQIAYARTHCQFYAGLPAQPLASIEEFRRLPFTTAGDLTRHGTALLCCPARQVRRMVTLQTSGTTAAPKRLAFTRHDLEGTRAFFRWGMGQLCQRGDPVAIFMPGTQPDGLCDLLSGALTDLGAVPLVYGCIRDYADAANFCRKAAPAVLVGMPVQLRRLALTAPDLRPRRVLLSADYIAPVLKDTLRRIWGCQVFEHFGMTESGLGCAVEVPGSQGMLCRRDVYLELDAGEIVLTTLDREAMPLIRYRTGDLGRMLPNGNLCAVLGRCSAGGRAVTIQALDAFLLGLDEVLDYRASLDGRVLTVSILGEAERARCILSAAFPDLELHTSAPSPDFFHFRGKRVLE